MNRVLLNEGVDDEGVYNLWMYVFDVCVRVFGCSMLFVRCIWSFPCSINARVDVIELLPYIM